MAQGKLKTLGKAAWNTKVPPAAFTPLGLSEYPQYDVDGMLLPGQDPMWSTNEDSSTVGDVAHNFAYTLPYIGPALMGKDLWDLVDLPGGLSKTKIPEEMLAPPTGPMSPADFHSAKGEPRGDALDAAAMAVPALAGIFTRPPAKITRKAVAALKKGAPKEEVWNDMGVFVGARDKMPRMELPAGPENFVQNFPLLGEGMLPFEVPLKTLLRKRDNPILEGLAAYDNLPVEFNPGFGINSAATYSDRAGNVVKLGIGEPTSQKRFQQIMAHELDHVAQYANGFPTGGNPAQFSLRDYPELAQTLSRSLRAPSSSVRNQVESAGSTREQIEAQLDAIRKLQRASYHGLEGERSARDSARRLYMSPEQRSLILPALANEKKLGWAPWMLDFPEWANDNDTFFELIKATRGLR